MLCPREKREAAEALLIGPHGLLSAQSTGRPTPEAPCEMRTCFQRDVDRITHSKSFRRLKHKTQVFLRLIQLLRRSKISLCDHADGRL